MGIEQQVYLKSDRRGRGLILVFCLAPMIVPLLTIAVKFALEDPHVLDWTQVLNSSAQASAPVSAPFHAGRLPTRDEFRASVIFAAPSGAVQEFQWMTGQTIVEQATAAPEAAPADLALRRDN
ncbi:MAG: hypothetical protein RIQ68_1476 [Pseudomonadota bacterium]|jgi:hypothetical protein